MTKKQVPMKIEVVSYLKDLKYLASLNATDELNHLHLYQYPFDKQLLAASSLYRQSRTLYLSLGGKHLPALSSTLRSLSEQNIFDDHIEYTPSESELLWFLNNASRVDKASQTVTALVKFNEISVFHEQNHRIVWRLLPPAPTEKRDLCRYLNFAESLVVMLDLAMGDELGKKTSQAFERLRLIYRPGGEHKWSKGAAPLYRQYLLSCFVATYLLLEMVHPKDILKAIDYMFPDQKKLNQDAVSRSLELSVLFTKNTNPQWQNLYWKSASDQLEVMHSESEEDALYLPEDPLDLESEFFYVHRVLDYFGLE